MNKIMFWIGIAVTAITVILLLTVREDVPLGVMGLLGILLIATSGYEPLKTKKR